MTEEMMQILIGLLAVVSAGVIIGWIITYRRLQGFLDGGFFVPGEDVLRITYYFLDESQYNLDSDEIVGRMTEYLQQAETETYDYPITGKEVLVAKEDTFNFYARKAHSMKPPPMRLIAIQIELIPKNPRK